MDTNTTDYGTSNIEMSKPDLENLIANLPSRPQPQKVIPSAKEILHIETRDWNSNKDFLIETWKERSEEFASNHQQAAALYKTRQSFLETNVIILMGFATLGNYSAETLTQKNVSFKWINMVIGFLNTTCVILEGIINYNQYASKRELHRKAYMNWSSFATKLEVTEALLYDEREDSKLFLIDCRTQYNELVINSPPLPFQMVINK